MIEITNKIAQMIKQVTGATLTTSALLVTTIAQAAEDRSAYFTQIPKDGTPIIFASEPSEVCSGERFIDFETGAYGVGTSTATTCFGEQSDVPPTCTAPGQTDCYINQGGNLVAIKEGDIPSKLRFGEVIHGKRGGALPYITPNWTYETNNGEVSNHEGTTNTRWLLSSATTCTGNWSSPTRSDFNLAALVGGFWAPTGETPLLTIGRVYSDGSTPQNRKYKFTNAAAAVQDVTDDQSATPTETICVQHTDSGTNAVNP